ncbi:MAG: DEAD/DEAH box helicase, partial [Ruminococcus sp.]|nr:DEAD/DEAH box helicase [Ruminococcus sp.]
MKIKELSLDTAVNKFFDEAERNGLERRQGQVEMSREIAQAIMDKKSLVVEAEVGIGKSIAYLVPIVLQFFCERRQVVIATSTIALQEQLERDVKAVLNMIGVKTKVEVAKGMKNYICLKRLNKFVKSNRDFEELFSRAKEGLQNKSDITVSERDWNNICIDSYGEKCEDCT